MKPIQLKQKDIPNIREQILENQNGKCAICGNEPEAPCLDHSHKKRNKGTGLIRGVLCRGCNVCIGLLENNIRRYGFIHDDLPEILRAIADYLEKDHYPYIHPSEAPKKKKLMKSSYNKLKKIYDGKAKFPEYPKSGILTKKLESLFEKYGITPEYYK